MLYLQLRVQCNVCQQFRYKLLLKADHLFYSQINGTNNAKWNHLVIKLQLFQFDSHVMAILPKAVT